MATTSKKSSGTKSTATKTKTSPPTTPAKKASPRKLSQKSKPHRLFLRTYQVGFGDCFLLTFQYKLKGGKTEDRHVLIDFGTTARPKGAPSNLMKLVAEDIERECKGKLHAVIATHRHKDHISGFATNEAGTATGNIIAGCQPDVVIQPWTEDPKAKKRARSATTVERDVNTAFLASLDNMHSVSSSILAEAKASHSRSGLSQSLVAQLEFLAVDNEGDEEPANKSAIDNLNRMAVRKKFYVSFDSKSGLEDVLPGVATHVLGPPTLEQSEEIKNEAFENEQFWMLRAGAGKIMLGGGGEQLFPKFNSSAYGQRTPPHTRWFIHRLHLARATQLLELVRILDDALNNTSIILLFEVGGKKLLFPGDAQIENWNYALHGAPETKRNEIKALLEDVSLYKVGHHGSRNATPHKLWDMFARRRDKKKSKKDLLTVVSTREDKHGHRKDSTEVPRDTLVTALKKGSKYFSTQELTGDDNICKLITIDL